ncbi:hypothetical protein NESM_000690400 [Novymonas esmeraldas]|uniref:Uncharacterized protein n=1 Tax=Novymonas esmeraldas TaxID=1808958 RepID=A0AAW0EWG2_9TRYP
MLNCFFGAELKPDGVPMSFAVPKGVSLVITQCAVTSVVPPAPAVAADAAAAAAAASHTPAAARSYAPVTLCVQGHGLPTRFAVCSLSPAQQLTCCPLQLIFSRPVSFVLVPQTGPTTATATATSSGAPTSSGKAGQRGQRSEQRAAVYPTVHLTGYYERAADEDEEEDHAAMDGIGSSDEESGGFGTDA